MKPPSGPFSAIQSAPHDISTHSFSKVKANGRESRKWQSAKREIRARIPRCNPLLELKPLSFICVYCVVVHIPGFLTPLPLIFPTPEREKRGVRLRDDAILIVRSSHVYFAKWFPPLPAHFLCVFNRCER